MPLTKTGFKIIKVLIQAAQCLPSGKKQENQGDLGHTGIIRTPLLLNLAKCFTASIALPTGGKTKQFSSKDKVCAKKFTPELPDEGYVLFESL